MRSAWDIVQQGMGIVSDVAWKVDNAEANQQYLQGTEFLRKATTDFNNSLATDPNPEGYLDKWNKQKDALWRQAQNLVKNPRALDALTRDWAAMDERQYSEITGVQTRARIDQITLKTGNTIQGIVSDNTRSNGDRKQAVAKALLPLVQIGQLKPEVALAEEQRLGKVIDENAMETGLTQIARAQGWDYALGLVDNPDFNHHFPSLNQDDRDTIRGRLETQARFQEAQAQKADQMANASYQGKILDSFMNWQEGKASVEQLRAMIDDPKGFTATPYGDATKKADMMMLISEISKMQAEQRAGARLALAEDKASQKEKEAVWNGDANDIITDPTLSRAGKDLRLAQLAADRGAGMDVLQKWRKQAELTINNKPYLDLRSKVFAMAKKQANGADPILSSVQANEIVGSLDKIFQTNPQVTIDQLSGKLDPLVEDAKKETVGNVLNDLLSTVPFGGVGPDVHERTNRMLYRGGSPGASAEAALSKKGVQIESQWYEGGRTYYRGQDASIYQVAPNGAIYKWDGKSWQTLK